MLRNICFTLFGPSLTYGLKRLQFILELSYVVLQLVHNIVGSELEESWCEGLKDNTNLSTLINGGPMYLRLVHQVDHVQNMFPNQNSFLHLSVHVATSSFMAALVRLLPKHGLERFPYLICSLHVLMFLPNNIVHASKHLEDIPQ